jgi:hypothetical protein
VADDGLPHLRNQLRQGPALRVAQAAPPVARQIEGPPVYAAPPVAAGLSFWQFTLRALTVVVALVFTAALAYYLLVGRSQPFAQLEQQPQSQQPQPQQQTAPQQQAEAEQPQDDQPEAQQAPAQPEPTDLGPRLAMPTDDKLIMLINSSLIALNQANATGNYTVLREIAAPGFQQANSPEKLSQAFKQLRSRNLDLTPVLLYQPKLYQRPAMSDKGMIRVTGYFPTSPERVNFDLIFQPVHGKWRLYGIAANTQRVQPSQPTPQSQGAPAPQPDAAEAVKPATPAKKPAAKPKPAAAEIEETPPPDVRDRIDNPPPAPPAEKPKQKSGWNPFGR